MAGVQIALRRRGLVLEPVGGVDEETVRSLPEGRIVTARVVRERSAPQNGLYHAFCADVAEVMRSMGSDEADAKVIDLRFRAALGLCDVVPTSPALRKATGCEIMAVPQSISFHKMDHAAFTSFLNRVFAFAATALIPHFPAGELKQRLSQRLAEYLPGEES